LRLFEGEVPPSPMHGRGRPGQHESVSPILSTCVCVSSLPHLRAMPGRPLRKAGSVATRDANGKVAPPPRRLRAGLAPVVWRRLSLSFDAALEDLSYRGDDSHRLAARTSARHDVMMICAKHAIEMSRERERQPILADLTRREFGYEA